jgi:hypothetical protein
MRTLLVAFLLATTAARAAAENFPKLANIYSHGSVDMTKVPSLARWDMLVLNSVWTEAQLAQVRALNPDIKLFFYVCAYCAEWPQDPSDPWTEANTAYASTNNLWWYDRNTQPASDWPGSRMVNITDAGHAGPQGSWRDYMAARIEALVASRPSLDGIMLDNYWRRLSWEQSTLQLDSDCNPTHNPSGCNGIADTPAVLDTLWNRALNDLAADLRGRFNGLEAGRARPLALVGNGASDYYSWLNGSIHEAFPSGWSNVDPGNPYGYNWNEEMFSPSAGYLVAPFATRPYATSIMNSVWTGTATQPDRSSDFERHKRFTLVSTLLGDGYYSLDAGLTGGNGALWWEPEYDNAGRGTGYLGPPRGPTVRIGVPSGPERVSNGNFASGATDWTWHPSNVTGSFGVENGTGRIDVQTVSPGGELKLWHSNVALQAGLSYTLSFRARADRPVDVTYHLYGTQCPGQTCLSNHTAHVGTAWQTYEVLFHAPSTATASLNLFVRVPSTVWLDDVSLRSGDVSVYKRDFERGTVLLNYTASPQTIQLGAPHTRLNIPGSSVFNGATITAETVPPWDGRIVLHDTVSSMPPEVPRGALHQNAPNPFNPSTRIAFELTAPEHVRLAIHDVRGRLVRVLVDDSLPAGTEHAVDWDGMDRMLLPVGSGTYFYILETPTFTEKRKMSLVR